MGCEVDLTPDRKLDCWVVDGVSWTPTRQQWGQCCGVDAKLVALIDEVCMSIGHDESQCPSDVGKSGTY